MLDLVALPAGYGLRVLSERETRALDSLMDHLLVWEAPSKAEQYVISADVADGVGADRSVVDVTRVGTLERPDEQVAQFVSDSIDPIEFASIIDAIGRFYGDAEGYEALAAIECNNHGLATQAELERHLGYRHFFIWQYEDVAPGANRYTKRIGWYTSTKTRPIILTRYRKAVTTVDPVTGHPDYRINSPFTIAELATFQVPPGYSIGDAQAVEGQFDDCLMAGAIGVHVAQTLHFEDRESLADMRRRLARERARASDLADRLRTRRDYQNTDATADEALGREEYDGWDGAQDSA